MLVTRIISGGQTGADQGALHAGKALSIETGGTAPKGWRTEIGPAPWLADYGLCENLSIGYPQRTAENVRDSDGTLIFGNPGSAGSQLTASCCRRFGKRYLIISLPYRNNSDFENAVVRLRDWLSPVSLIDKRKPIAILNVAGNRESSNPGIATAVCALLLRTLG